VYRTRDQPPGKRADKNVPARYMVVYQVHRFETNIKGVDSTSSPSRKATLLEFAMLFANYPCSRFRTQFSRGTAVVSDYVPEFGHLECFTKWILTLKGPELQQ
jgi:hypothetical protein